MAENKEWKFWRSEKDPSIKGVNPQRYKEGRAHLHVRKEGDGTEIFDPDDPDEGHNDEGLLAKISANIEESGFRSTKEIDILRLGSDVLDGRITVAESVEKMVQACINPFGVDLKEATIVASSDLHYCVDPELRVRQNSLESWLYKLIHIWEKCSFYSEEVINIFANLKEIREKGIAEDSKKILETVMGDSVGNKQILLTELSDKYKDANAVKFWWNGLVMVNKYLLNGAKPDDLKDQGILDNLLSRPYDSLMTILQFGYSLRKGDPKEWLNIERYVRRNQANEHLRAVLPNILSKSNLKSTVIDCNLGDVVHDAGTLKDREIEVSDRIGYLKNLGNKLNKGVKIFMANLIGNHDMDPRVYGAFESSLGLYGSGIYIQEIGDEGPVIIALDSNIFHDDYVNTIKDFQSKRANICLEIVQKTQLEVMKLFKEKYKDRKIILKTHNPLTLAGDIRKHDSDWMEVVSPELVIAGHTHRNSKEKPTVFEKILAESYGGGRLEVVSSVSDIHTDGVQSLPQILLVDIDANGWNVKRVEVQ